MKKLLIYFCFTLTLQLSAQDLSLNKALELAKSLKVEQTNLDVLSQEIDLKIQKSKRLPLIYGDANLQRNLIVPTTPVPSIAFDSNANLNDITPLKFATDWTAKAGVQFSVDIFNPENKSKIKSSEIDYLISKVYRNQAEYDFKTLIVDLYAQTFLAQQQYDVALLNEQSFNESLDIILKRNKAGRVSDFEKNEALQKAIELEMNRNEAQLLLKNKYIQLSNYIDLSNYNNFSTSIDEIIENEIKIYNSDIEKLLLEIKNVETQIQNNDLSILPKVSLNAFYGSQFFDNDFQIFKSNNWYGNSYVNLSLRIPISENYERKLKSKQLEFELQNTKSKLLETQQANDIVNKQKLNDILILKQKLNSYKQMITLATDNLNITKVKVNEGTALITEYNNSLEKLMSLKLKLWQLSYDLLMKSLE